jgi:hypothetical protein
MSRQRHGIFHAKIKFMTGVGMNVNLNEKLNSNVNGHEEAWRGGKTKKAAMQMAGSGMKFNFFPPVSSFSGAFYVCN